MRYVQLAHNVWDPKARCAKARVLYSFGREDRLDVEALRRLAHSISHLLPPGDNTGQAGPLDDAGLRFVGSRPFGDGWVLGQLWKSLQLDQAIAGAAGDRPFYAAFERALYALVAERALVSTGIPGTGEWFGECVTAPEVGVVPFRQLNRTLEFANDMSETLQQEIFWRTAYLSELRADLVYFGTSVTHFDLDGGGPQEATIGFAATPEGIPVRCWVWPGRPANASLLLEVKQDLERWQLGRVVHVFDGDSQELSGERDGSPHSYVAGRRIQSLDPQTAAIFSHPGRYRKLRDRLAVKEVDMGARGTPTRYVVLKNERQAERDRTERGRVIMELEEELAYLETLPEYDQRMAFSRLERHPVYGRYVRAAKTGRPRIDKKKVHSEERFDGKYLLETTDTTLSAAQAAQGYKNFMEIADTFHTLCRAVNHQRFVRCDDGHIRAQVLICWLALVVVRSVEVRTGYPWRHVREVLQHMHVGAFSGRDGTVLQRTETTSEQQQLFDAIGVAHPPRFIQINASTSQTA